MTQIQLQSSVTAESTVTAADVVLWIATYNNQENIAQAFRAVEIASTTSDTKHVE
jgi:hypothetical protein